MDLDYDALRILEAVIRSGSFEAAARLYNVTQSAVSQRMKQLEERTGSVLIVRGRPCVPTEDGLLLCQHFEQVMLLEHELMQRMGDPTTMDGRRAAKIRVSVNSDSLATWFPEVLERASRELDLILEVIPDDQEFTEDRLKNGDALAVVTSHENTIPGATLTRLGTMEYLAVASPDFFATHFRADGVSLQTLSGAPTILFDRKDTLPEQWMENAFGDSVALPAHLIPSYEGLLRCCLIGVGWIMMPELTVGPLIAEGELIALNPEVTVSVPLCWQTRTQSSTLLLDLTSIVEDVAKVTFSSEQELMSLS